LQLKRIGDLILTTPALWALRENLPKAHIVLAVEAGCREMLPAIDFVDETLVYERRDRMGRCGGICCCGIMIRVWILRGRIGRRCSG